MTDFINIEMTFCLIFIEICPWLWCHLYPP